MLQNVQLEDGAADTVCWCWTEDQNYSSTSAYGAMFIGSVKPLGAKEIWKTNALSKVKFF
jgi:hypothetical protein